jgi:hypothetical protein
MMLDMVVSCMCICVCLFVSSHYQVIFCVEKFYCTSKITCVHTKGRMVLVLSRHKVVNVYCRHGHIKINIMITMTHDDAAV